MSEFFQTDLFGNIIDAYPGDKKSSRNKKDVPKVKWSFSRRNTMETCLRKYYYQYYAAKLIQGAVSGFDNVKFLKTLSSKHLVAGKIIHNLIRVYLTKNQAGSDFSIEWMKQKAKEKIQQSIEYSRLAFSGVQRHYDYPPFLLQEIFYEDNAAVQIYQEVEAKVIEALENFINSDQFEEFRSAGKLIGTFVEKKFSLVLNEKVTVSGEADLAYHTNNGFVITDWKTGKKEDGNDSMQLLTYTWWATDQINADKSKVKIYKAYLNQNIKKEFSLSEHEIFRNKLAVRQSAESMLEMAEFGVAGDELAFTPCKQEKICANCQFQKICK